MKKIRPIAIYLPQYHPIPENDEWWGKGFTEWTNVTKAKPLFAGHYQPHLPSDLGFYDLRLAEVRMAQAEMAKQYGIYGFCYYHYWFNGKLVLERPLGEVLKSNQPDFPFMICWANENWTKVWDGDSNHILLEQKYSEQDDIEHIRYLLPYLKDPRYIKVNGKPILAIYKSALLPNVENTIRIWREEAIKQKIDLYICRFDCHDSVGKEFLVHGVDAVIDFAPFGAAFQAFKKKRRIRRTISYFSRKFLKNKLIGDVIANKVDYSKYVDFVINHPLPDYKIYPGVTPMWDNSARKKGNYFMFTNSNPFDYGRWLDHIVRTFAPYSEEENFIFINAWNEWAEGNHLEPCMKWGRKYLEKTKEILKGTVCNE